MSVRIINADVMEGLRQLPDESVQCVVTSPPYWGLRDYGAEGQIGLEPTLGEHIDVMVAVFREVRRVLRKDGTLWLNYGDAYCSVGHKKSHSGFGTSTLNGVGNAHSPTRRENDASDMGLKHKDLCGIPWRLALALQADGWWLRQDIIWAKPNPMPESIKDRCTKAHEYIFLLTKSDRYHFDAEGIAEEASPNTHARCAQNVAEQEGSYRAHGGKGRGGRSMKAMRPGVTPKSAPNDSNIRAKESWHASTTEVLPLRNKRSVWTVATQPFSEAHFATFPPDLIEPCIKAGCPKGGTVLDPFGGAGTTGLVADRLERNAILIELNPEYAAMAHKRIEGDAGMFSSVTTEDAA